MKHIIFISTLIAIVFPVQTIQKKTANIMTTGIVVASLAGSYNVWCLTKKEIHSAVFGVANLFIGLCSYHYLHTLTPEGLLKIADDCVDELMVYKLAKTSFKEDKVFFNTVYDIFLTHDLPLISAYNHLIHLLPKLRHIFELLDRAALGISKDTPLQEKYDFVLLRTETLFKNISSAIKRIRAHKDYLLQLQVYKEFLADDKSAMPQKIMYSHKSSMWKDFKRSFGFCK